MAIPDDSPLRAVVMLALVAVEFVLLTWYIHASKRLAAMALLANARDVDFAFMRDHLQISDSDLSKQMAELAKAGYVESLKHGRGPGGSTPFRITRIGRRPTLPTARRCS
jgi:winged helix DNA-binding protein